MNGDGTEVVRLLAISVPESESSPSRSGDGDGRVEEESAGDELGERQDLSAVSSRGEVNVAPDRQEGNNQEECAMGVDVTLADGICLAVQS